jgi:6-phosphogluconolactonase (cycloisomerase 2 family)
LVYVLNSVGSGSIVALNLHPDGHLQQIENSTAYLTATNSGGSSLSISPNGRLLAVSPAFLLPSGLSLTQ